MDIGPDERFAGRFVPEIPAQCKPHNGDHGPALFHIFLCRIGFQNNMVFDHHIIDSMVMQNLVEKFAYRLFPYLDGNQLIDREGLGIVRKINPSQGRNLL